MIQIEAMTHPVGGGDGLEAASLLPLAALLAVCIQRQVSDTIIETTHFVSKKSALTITVRRLEKVGN